MPNRAISSSTISFLIGVGLIASLLWILFLPAAKIRKKGETALRFAQVFSDQVLFDGCANERGRVGAAQFAANVQWPTKADFENMLGHLVTLSTDNGVLEDGCVYLSSTTHETNNARFWNLFFKPSNSEIRLGHNYKNGSDLNRTVRAVLAF